MTLGRAPSSDHVGAQAPWDQEPGGGVTPKDLSPGADHPASGPQSVVNMLRPTCSPSCTGARC